ncbi:3-phenylpropionate/trans-cinnamate dioxygenase ferredoxin reductase subunit [Arboricoccus pini]|uniref:3-phenylpropionate/trans-cinnamate dioxygenase ferredoxin reductase subunit n=1 Tax=Arboricoccus pini TaxID=1963835 RepID=A0A212QYY7_9PROT|nr:FAD-dependent oxidoreductase [Arboricoccus pini]SNB64935.1 3-phenylpropionate/trans-cinnamate dioxygenase ferredoxin reductase subunit [Arboricoccus pini]
MADAVDKRTIIIIGSGQGGYQMAASLRDEGFDGRLLLIGDEPGFPYQRPPLSKAYLTGKTVEEALRLRPPAYYADKKIELIEGRRATAIDRAARRVVLNDGQSLVYDELVLATGARNRTLHVPGHDLDGIFYLRTLADAQSLKGSMAGISRAVVIGAGFIGLEFAAVARAAGIDVTVVEATTRPLGRALSPITSQYFVDAHEAWGTRFVLGTGISHFDGVGGQVTHVVTQDGQQLAADLVLVGIGVLPNQELAAEAGLACENGIVVNQFLRTEDPHVSAIGDCCLYPSFFAAGPTRLESVQNAVDQARNVAARLMGRPTPYAGIPWFWSDQGDLKLQIVGLTGGHDSAVVRGDPAGRKFSVFCFGNGRLLGIESINQAGDHMAGRKLLAGHHDLTPDKAVDLEFDLRLYAKEIPPVARTDD